MTYKIAIGVSYSGFILSLEVEQYLLDEYGVVDYWLLDRHDPRLIEAIEHELEAGRNPHLYNYGKIKIKEINHHEYYIAEHDACESVITPDIIEKRWIRI